MEYYIVYKTINLVNGKYYIGKHKVKTKEFDFYFGSSDVINNAIAKYGIENFRREVLFETDNEEECYRMEEQILGNLWKTDENCYNKQAGGKGFPSGDKHYAVHGFTEQHKKNLSGSRKKRKPHSEETKRKMSKSRTGLKRTTETRAKMSEAQAGKNNPMFGKKHSTAKRKEIGDKLRGKYTGERCSAFKGYYITPWGKFASVREAADCINVIGKSTIRTWCINSHKKITKNMIGISKYLTSDMLGKTFNDIGFNFEQKYDHMGH
jgi:group I intron endonuclease